MMRTSSTISYILLLFLTLNACKKEVKETEEPTQMERVIAVHDELMPKMGVIGNLISELNNNEDSLQVETVKDLKKSHDLMMNWMRKFGEQFDSDEVMKGKVLSEDKTRMLDLQEQKVNVLKKQMNESIERAKQLLKAN